MEINLLVLNVGNTRLAVGTFVAGELKNVMRISHNQRVDWAGVIAEAWSQIQKRPMPAIAGASVNPPLVEPLEHTVMQATGQQVQWVGRQLDVPITVRTEQPEQTGIDRVLNVAAAYEQMGKACLVVDAGTAITLDCCNDAGEFIGGAIAPGLDMQLDVLHTGTAKLPRVDFHLPGQAIGASTAESILQGVYGGIRGLVRHISEEYATVLGQWPEIIATGGDARRLFEGWELIHAVAPDLTMYGIALAYANHHIKHGT